MPSVFDKRFKRIGFPHLLSQYGEPVVYRPRSGGARSIVAIIEREPHSFYQAGELVTPTFVIRVKNDCGEGISSSEVDTGGDQIELREDVGDIQGRYTSVMKKMSDDSGVLVLALM